MANTLGQLLVELGINTAAFKGGLDKATYQAKAFAGELKQSFSQLGSAIKQLGAEFGGIGGAAGSAFGSVMDAVEPLIGSLGTVGGAVAGVTVALAAVGIAAVGAAAHFSETAAQLYGLSQRTGIAVDALSVLGDVASTKGIGVEQMSRAIEKMDRAALKAAQSGPTASNAFKDIGVSVTDAAGKMRGAEDIFNDLTAKFAAMPDGPKKTAEAMKIFGRTGAELIPLMNEGGKGIGEMEEHFRRLNAVIDADTAKAGDKFNDTMTIVKSAFTGIENELAKALLPALQVVADELLSFFEDNSGAIKEFADGMANIGKVTINVFQIIGTTLGLLFTGIVGLISQIQNIGGALSDVGSDVASGNFGKIFDDLKSHAKTASGEVKNTFGTMWNDIKSAGSGIANVWTDKLAKNDRKPGSGDEANEHGDLSFIDKAVSQASRAAEKLAGLAKAIAEVGAAQIEANAHAQAAEEIGKLQDEAVQKGIEHTQAYRDALAAAIPKLEAAALWQETFKAALQSDKELQAFNLKMREQVAALQAAAASQTEIQAQWGKTDATLLPLREHLANVTSEYDKLRNTRGADPKYVDELRVAIEKLTAEYGDAVANVKALNSAFADSKATEETKKLDQQLVALLADQNKLIAGDAFLNIAEQTEIWGTKLGLTTAQIQKLIPQLERIREIQAQNANLNVGKGLGYDAQTMNTLKAQIDSLNKGWKDAGMSEEQYRRTLAQIVAQQADLKAKTGGFVDGIKAGFADFKASTENLGETMHKVIGEGLKGITNDFASMIATGKADWAGLVANMEQMLLQSAIHKILASLFDSISNAFGGSGGGFMGQLFGGFKAGGGDVTPGKSYIVGEKGPELFTPGTSGTILPNGSSMTGGQSIVQNWTINTPDANSFRKSKGQISSEMYREAANSHARMRG